MDQKMIIITQYNIKSYQTHPCIPNNSVLNLTHPYVTNALGETIIKYAVISIDIGVRHGPLVVIR